MSQPSLQFGKSLFLIPSPQGDHGLLYVRHHGAADRDSVLVVQHQPGTIQLLDVVEVYKKGPVRKDKARIVDFGKQLFDPTAVLEITLSVRDDLDAALHLLDIEDVLVENTGIVLIVLHHNRTGIRFSRVARACSRASGRAFSKSSLETYRRACTLYPSVA